MKHGKCLYLFRTLAILVIVLGTERLTIGQRVENPDWIRLRSESNDLSVAFPKNYQSSSDDKGFRLGTFTKKFSLSSYKDFEYRNIKFLTAFNGGASFWIIRYETDDNPLARRLLISNYSVPGEYTEIALGGFEGVSSFRSSRQLYTHQIIIGSKNAVYHVFGGAMTRENESLKYFFNSIILNGQRLYSIDPKTETSDTRDALSFSVVRDTPFLIEDVSEVIAKSKSELPGEPIVNDAAAAKPLVLMIKPKARYTDEARKKGINGTVRLKVTFSADGSVSKIAILNKGLPNGLNYQATQAARLIRFLPQETAAGPITVQRTVEYGFSIY